MTRRTLVAERRTRPATRGRKSVRTRAVKSAALSAGGGTLYSVHPGVVMVQKWIGELPLKTGRSLEEWLAHIRKCGPKDEKAARDWLAAEHRLGTNTAWWLAEKALGDAQKLAEDTPEGYLKLAPKYVEQMYGGPRSLLRPIHDALIVLARDLGDDVRICPCTTMVPLYRQHVFAQIKPATNKRIDLGLALAHEPFTSRLLDTGGRAKKDRITHRVAIAALSEIDLQVRRWLKQAYESDGA
jgi:hypothetical protein